MPRFYDNARLGDGASDTQRGNASLVCQGYFPECFQRDECGDGGRCFRADRRGYQRVHRILDRLRVKAGDAERPWLTTALAAIERERAQG